MKELWIEPRLSESLTAAGCFQAALALEMLQLGQSAFSTQRFYGLMTNDDYVPLLLQGFPVRAKFYVPGAERGSGPGSDEYVASEVVRIDDSPPAALFEVPDGLRPVDSPREVF